MGGLGHWRVSLRTNVNVPEEAANRGGRIVGKHGSIACKQLPGARLTLRESEFVLMKSGALISGYEEIGLRRVRSRENGFYV